MVWWNAIIPVIHACMLFSLFRWLQSRNYGRFSWCPYISYLTLTSQKTVLLGWPRTLNLATEISKPLERYYQTLSPAEMLSDIGASLSAKLALKKAFFCSFENLINNRWRLRRRSLGKSLNQCSQPTVWWWITPNTANSDVHAVPWVPEAFLARFPVAAYVLYCDLFSRR